MNPLHSDMLKRNVDMLCAAQMWQYFSLLFTTKVLTRKLNQIHPWSLFYWAQFALWAHILNLNTAVLAKYIFALVSLQTLSLIHSLTPPWPSITPPLCIFVSASGRLCSNWGKYQECHKVWTIGTVAFPEHEPFFLFPQNLIDSRPSYGAVETADCNFSSAFNNLFVSF